MWRCPKHVETVLNIWSMSSWVCAAGNQESFKFTKLSFEQDRSEKQTMFYFCFTTVINFKVLDSRKGAGCVLADHLTRAVGFHR